MAKSWGRAESTSLRTLPALPAPPDDALLPPLFICGFRPSRRLCTLFSGCQWVDRSGGRAGGRPERTDRASSGAPAAVGARSRAAGTTAPRRPRGALPAPAPSPGLAPRRRHFEQPGQRRREPDRATSPFSLRPNSARAHTKEGEETRELGGWFSCRGLDSSRDWGWSRRLRTAGRGGDARPQGAGEAAGGRGAGSTVWRHPGVGRRWWGSLSVARLRSGDDSRGGGYRGQRRGR